MSYQPKITGNKLNLVFLGTPEIACETIKSLKNDSRINFLATITQEDKPVGRKQILTAPPVKTTAIDMNIPVFQVKNSSELEEKLQQFEKIDIILVFAFGMILPKSVLNKAEKAVINIHTSLLPRYRGASPIQQSLLNGDEKTGISYIVLDEKMDHGPLIAQLETEINEQDDHESLSAKLSKLSANNTADILSKYFNNQLSEKEQNHDQATFCKKIKKEDGQIFFTESCQEIINKARAFKEWPEIYFSHLGKKYKLRKIEDGKTHLPAKTISINQKELLIGTNSTSISIKEIQPEGKSSMDIKSFLNGYKNFFENGSEIKA